ncbi:MAG: DUF402 domain-containing protein [Dehalococcoidia bacterium]|nr:DUF402 domain-containing protein [Dehalococcoidia bacterium]
MTTQNIWRPGDTIVVQDVWRGRLWTARPMTVVVDDGQHLALWSPKGTVWKGSTTPPSRPRPEERLERILQCLDLCDWILQDRSLEMDLMWLLEPDIGYSVTLNWTGSGQPGSWYVNLQEPFERSHQGIRTMDLMLDVIVRRDGTWSWKDEEEFEAAVERGLLSSGKAAWLRDQAMQAIANVTSQETMFTQPWLGWRPDPAWGIPVLPEGWELT